MTVSGVKVVVVCITLRLPGMLVNVATISSGCARDTSRAVETLTRSFVKSQIPPSTLAYKEKVTVVATTTKTVHASTVLGAAQSPKLQFTTLHVTANTWEHGHAPVHWLTV